MSETETPTPRLPFPTNVPSVSFKTVTKNTVTGAVASWDWYWQTTEQPNTLERMQQLLQKWRDELGTKLIQLMASDAMVVGYWVTYRNGTAFNKSWKADGRAGDNTVAGVTTQDVLPDADALILRKLTGQAGRRHAGRVFIPHIAEAASKNGLVDDDDVTLATQLAAFLGADLEVDDACTLHSRHWNRKDGVLEVITQVVAVSQFGSRRDRRRQQLALPL